MITITIDSIKIRVRIEIRDDGNVWVLLLDGTACSVPAPYRDSIKYDVLKLVDSGYTAYEAITRMS